MPFSKTGSMPRGAAARCADEADMNPTLRAVVYARYSSDLQSDASIEDQVEVLSEVNRHVCGVGRADLRKPVG